MTMSTNLAGFGEALVLELEDNFESVEDVEARSFWPDEITRAEHTIYCGHYGEQVFTLSDAPQIVAFLHRRHHSPFPVSLLVHCYAGVSQSAAGAHWASVRFRLPIGCNRSAHYATPRLIA
jgi:protein-tyrosine phosphatase